MKKRKYRRKGKGRRPLYENPRTRAVINIITTILVAVVIVLVISIIAGKDKGKEPMAGNRTEKVQEHTPINVTVKKESGNIGRDSGTNTQGKTAGGNTPQKVIPAERRKTTRTSVTRIRDLEIPAKLTDRPEEIIRHMGYTVSFNEKLGIANWVAYELNPLEVEGTAERSSRFIPDPMVSGRCPDHDDYTHSGYDRGHLAPAADMKWSKAAMEESFYMTNICPQNHKLNSGVWLAYEERGRQWASEKAIYIVCGPVTGKMPQRIGDYEVAVPSHFYKIFLKQEKGEYTALGILCPNVAERKKMRDYVVSVDFIEDMTGIDFFPALPDSVEKRIEAETPYNLWGIK